MPLRCEACLFGLFGAAWLADALSGYPRIFADLSEEALKPQDWGQCQLSTTAECLIEYQTGRYDGAQNHRAMEFESITRSLVRPKAIQLLLLFTSVWRNRQRRRLLRAAVQQCSLAVEADDVAWRFLLGQAPPEAEAIRLAAEEASRHDDLLLLNVPDEMRYAHIGDAYELQEPHPELVKIVVALRYLKRTLDFKYVLLADDDSFVNVPAAVELTRLLSPERVYIGNMIDTVPQRWDAKLQKIKPEYTVNIYLSQATKVPVFAHGLGFMISADIGHLVADVGLHFKKKGNDDMLFGVWLRSIEHLYFLHYWIWFHDHWEFDGVFSIKECDPAAVVVHRMTPERWRTFNPHECHLCGGAPSWPLDTEADPPAVTVPPQPEPERKTCTKPHELACQWAPKRRMMARLQGDAECWNTCSAEAVVNMSGHFPSTATEEDIRRFQKDFGSQPVACPLSLCAALCQPDGPWNSLCPATAPSSPSLVKKTPTATPPPLLSILVFGSRWGADRALRRSLRRALRRCTTPQLGAGNVEYLFVMATMPNASQPALRAAAFEEALPAAFVMFFGSNLTTSQKGGSSHFC
eukprot:TRINITY_DN23627_c0_g1_i2.p1 TRINITY_DN23627_c0_g1~~TRINITY_DN23627_c0_g1_i2.p1  ORF type:complete len:578 (-),score=117.08 TRINITY_DN23627_c0_g1_i2:2-1735(-)